MANSDSLREAQQRLARIAYIRVNSWRHFRTDTDMEMDDGHKVQNNDETLSLQHTRATAASTNNKTHSRGRCGGEKARTDVAAKPAEMQSGPAAQAEHPPALCTSTSRRPECQEVVSCSISGDVPALVPPSQRCPSGPQTVTRSQISGRNISRRAFLSGAPFYLVYNGGAPRDQCT